MEVGLWLSWGGEKERARTFIASSLVLSGYLYSNITDYTIRPRISAHFLLPPQQPPPIVPLPAVLIDSLSPRSMSSCIRSSTIFS